METSSVFKAFLLISGGIATFIGGALLMDPIGFQAGAGIDLAGHTNLLSETRAQGAMLLAAGLMITAGAVVARLAFASTAVAAALYLSYGLARTVSAFVDGAPHETLVAATLIELAIGSVALLGFLRSRTAVAQ